MADDTLQPTSDPSEAGRGQSRGNPRGPREGREPGGFRIRLSDNEMQAARALQEAFGLRSTVAVLGFSLRALAQQLEAGQLDALIAQQQSQAASRPPAAGGRRDGERRDGERRPGRDEGRGGEPARAARANPFARPSRPTPPAPEPEPSAVAGEAEADDSGAAAPEPTNEVSISSDTDLSEAGMATAEPTEAIPAEATAAEEA
jgi:hypothetical protein